MGKAFTSLLFALWMVPAVAQSSPLPLQPVSQIAFCETGPDHAVHACDWQSVQLPHRWRPTRGTQGWAVYRIVLSPAQPSRVALLA
jgi:hypothetical protein